MTSAHRVLRSRYVDSVVLMRLAQALAAEAGIEDSAALMGTPANRALLVEGGFIGPRLETAPDDLVVAVKAGSPGDAAAALARVDALLTAAPAAERRTAPTVRALEDALALRAGANIAAISLPGEYAAAEARRALERGLHVFLFSSNVPLADEIELKKLAAERGLLCMGPDCGTAIVSSAGLGFANVVQRGPVGVVGVSGTGIQEICSLLDRYGVGLSHAIGCGSRDLLADVGGATTFAALDALLDDAQTEAVVVVSKPADPGVAARLRARSAAAPKPVLLGFVGEDGMTLDELARQAALAVGIDSLEVPDELPEEELDELRTRGAGCWLRGLYSGGTLAYEAQLVLREAGLTVASNVPLAGSPRLADARVSEGHTVVDLGAEEFTSGRPHPMIDARERRARLLQEANDPETAVVLLDVVLGYGAAPDPAGDLADVIAAAAASVPVLVHVCGTAADPQGLAGQEATLREAGARLLPTNAALARTAAALLAGVGSAR